MFLDIGNWQTIYFNRVERFSDLISSYMGHSNRKSIYKTVSEISVDSNMFYWKAFPVHYLLWKLNNSVTKKNKYIKKCFMVFEYIESFCLALKLFWIWYRVEARKDQQNFIWYISFLSIVYTPKAETRRNIYETRIHFTLLGILEIFQPGYT